MVNSNKYLYLILVKISNSSSCNNNNRHRSILVSKVSKAHTEITNRVWNKLKFEISLNKDEKLKIIYRIYILLLYL